MTFFNPDFNRQENSLMTSNFNGVKTLGNFKPINGVDMITNEDKNEGCSKKLIKKGNLGKYKKEHILVYKYQLIKHYQFVL